MSVIMASRFNDLDPRMHRIIDRTKENDVRFRIAFVTIVTKFTFNVYLDINLGDPSCS